VRSPSVAQIKLAQAVLDGFLLGYDGWGLWEFVGRRTRTLHDQTRLSNFRTELARRFLHVTDWHAELRVAFYKDVDSGDIRYAHREFEATRHRLFLGARVEKLLDTVGRVMAVAIKETLNGTLIARFQDRVLCEGKIKQRAEIAAHLAKAFPGSSFELQFDAVRS
jgi:hypothetical protein